MFLLPFFWCAELDGRQQGLKQDVMEANSKGKALICIWVYNFLYNTVSTKNSRPVFAWAQVLFSGLFSAAVIPAPSAWAESLMPSLQGEYWALPTVDCLFEWRQCGYLYIGWKHSPRCVFEKQRLMMHVLWLPSLFLCLAISEAFRPRSWRVFVLENAFPKEMAWGLDKMSPAS